MVERTFLNRSALVATTLGVITFGGLAAAEQYEVNGYAKQIEAADQLDVDSRESRALVEDWRDAKQDAEADRWIPAGAALGAFIVGGIVYVDGRPRKVKEAATAARPLAASAPPNPPATKATAAVAKPTAPPAAS